MKIMCLVLLLMLCGCAQEKHTREFWVYEMKTRADVENFVDKMPEVSFCFGLTRVEAIDSYKTCMLEAIKEREKDMPAILDSESIMIYANEIDVLAGEKFATNHQEKFMPSDLNYVTKQKCEEFYKKYRHLFLAKKK